MTSNFWWWCFSSGFVPRVSFCSVCPSPWLPSVQQLWRSFRRWLRVCESYRPGLLWSVGGCPSRETHHQLHRHWLPGWTCIFPVLPVGGPEPNRRASAAKQNEHAENTMNMQIEMKLFGRKQPAPNVWRWQQSAAWLGRGAHKQSMTTTADFHEWEIVEFLGKISSFTRERELFLFHTKGAWVWKIMCFFVVKLS